VLNITDDIKLENVEETLTIQNRELDLQEGDIGLKFAALQSGKQETL
jgi:hypothetical protein